jgi:hypothetical protein
MSEKSGQDLVIRIAKPADAAVCGQICYEAFAALSAKHSFPCDFPDPETTVGLFSMLFSSPGFYCVVAESGGRIVGSNCLEERSLIGGIGPISIDLRAQNIGLGKKLMLATMERANKTCPAGVRLVQAAYHNRSLSLYQSLGFDVREPLSCVQGRTRERNVAGCAVRPAELGDVAACNALARRVHGFDRGAELTQGIQDGTARVVEREGRISGYASDLAFFGHATAESNQDIQALMCSVESFGGSGILVPSRNNSLLRWSLANGLKVVEQMTLMTMGLYNEPGGAWIPSVAF